MKASEIQPKKLVIFDIDDTLVHTQTKVHVIKDGEVVDILNSHDFTHYQLAPGEEFDFGDFRNAREFFEKSRPIIPMMNQLKRDIATGNKVVMVTARADFDDKELFLDTFRKYGVDIDKVHVYRAGNIKGGTTEQRKKQIIKTLLDKDDYTKAIMYDDAKPNLHTFMELKKDHPKTRFYAWHVSLEGEASEYMRESLVSEKKKKRRRSIWAAYGPGPYGGYGYDIGYSGADGGGVGEDVDLKELNIASTLKFIKDAHSDQLYGKLPYWRHPRAVALTGRKIFGSKFNSEAVKTAFLHDVVEDTNVGLDELRKLGFSDDVITAVSLLTKDKSMSYTDNIQRIINSGSKLAMMVKYADNYENYTGDKSDWATDRAEASNQKYLKSLNTLGDVLGVNHHLGEASYEGNVGMMEVANFFKVATDAQKKLFKELLEKGKRGLAWKLIQDVTDMRLQGDEFREDRTADVVFDTGEKKRVRYQPTNKDIVDTIVNYYLKQGLKVIKVDDEEIDWNTVPEDVEEGWRDTLAGLALGAGVAMGGPASAKVEKVVVSPGQTVYSIAKAFDTTPREIQKLNKLDRNFTIKPGQELKVPKLDWTYLPPEKEKEPETKKSVSKKTDNIKTKTLTGKPFESLVTKAARAGGITDPVELAAFLAQVAVETGDFSTIKERGNRKYIERMYDRKYNPQGAKGIGNTKIGDGWRFRGRGFLQITGRYNYSAASKAIGVNLVKNPELLMQPEIAAKASVWYWKWRVRPNVTDFNDTAKITELVQGGASHLDRRQDAFRDFKKFKLAQI